MTKTKCGLPEVCEFCGEKLEWDSVNLVCNNPSCPQKGKENLKAWIMNIAPYEGMGWKTIENMINAPEYVGSGMVITVETLSKGQVHELPNYNKKFERHSWNEILAILARGEISISSFLMALNVPGLGRKGALAFEDYCFNSNSEGVEILSNIANGTLTDEKAQIMSKILQDKNVVGRLTGEYNEYFKACFDLVNVRLIWPVKNTDDNNNASVVTELIEPKGDVVITGRLSIKRADFERLLIANGFNPVSKIKADTVCLITDNPDSGTVKNKEADNLGIEKITEANFRAKYNIA